MVAQRPGAGGIVDAHRHRGVVGFVAEAAENRRCAASGSIRALRPVVGGPSARGTAFTLSTPARLTVTAGFDGALPPRTEGAERQGEIDEDGNTAELERVAAVGIRDGVVGRLLVAIDHAPPRAVVTGAVDADHSLPMFVAVATRELADTPVVTDQRIRITEALFAEAIERHRHAEIEAVCTEGPRHEIHGAFDRVLDIVSQRLEPQASACIEGVR